MIYAPSIECDECHREISDGDALCAFPEDEHTGGMWIVHNTPECNLTPLVTAVKTGVFGFMNPATRRALQIIITSHA